jgi:hypothetical protein
MHSEKRKLNSHIPCRELPVHYNILIRKRENEIWSENDISDVRTQNIQGGLHNENEDKYRNRKIIVLLKTNNCREWNHCF